VLRRTSRGARGTDHRAERRGQGSGSVHAWRSVQRQIVREAIARGDGPAGLKLARALAMATYRSAVSSSCVSAVRRSGSRSASASRSRNTCSPGATIMFRSIVPRPFCLERVDRSAPDGCDAGAHARDADRGARGSAGSLRRHAGSRGAAHGPRQLIEINSIFGHDAFLKEGAALTPIIKRAVSEPLL